jgi:hypothetical protein
VCGQKSVQDTLETLFNKVRRKSQPGCNFVARGGIQQSILQQAVVVLICLCVFFVLVFGWILCLKSEFFY